VIPERLKVFGLLRQANGRDWGLVAAYLLRATTHCLPVRSRTFQWITPFLFFELLILMIVHCCVKPIKLSVDNFTAQITREMLR